MYCKLINLTAPLVILCIGVPSSCQWSYSYRECWTVPGLMSCSLSVSCRHLLDELHGQKEQQVFELHCLPNVLKLLKTTCTFCWRCTCWYTCILYPRSLPSPSGTHSVIGTSWRLTLLRRWIVPSPVTLLALSHEQTFLCCMFESVVVWTVYVFIGSGIQCCLYRCVVFISVILLM